MRQLLGGQRLALCGLDADGLLAADDAQLGVQCVDALAAVVHLGRRGVQADGHAGAGGVEQADRLVGQLARRDVAVAELDGGFQRLVEDLHLVVLFHRAGHAAHHQDGLGLVGLVDLHGLEAAGQRRVLLDVLLVFGKGGGADGAQRAARQRGLEQVGRVAGASRAARAHQRVRLVDEQDDGLRTGLHLLDHRAQALLELALHAGAGLQQAHVQRQQLDVLQRRRHVAARDALREAFDHRGLAHTGLADQDGVVLAPAHQDVDHLADLVVAADDRVHLAAARLFGQVGGELLQCLLLAHRGRGQRTAGLAGRAGAGAVAGRFAIFGRSLDDGRQVIGQVVGLDLLELARDREQRVAQALGLQHGQQDVAAAHRRVLVHQRGKDPGLAHRRVDAVGDVADGRGPARQAVQRGRDVLGQHRGVQRVVLDDAVPVAVGVLHDLGDPVLQLDVRVASQLAEDGGAFHCLVGQRVEFSEDGNATDLGHGVVSFWWGSGWCGSVPVRRPRHR